MLKTKLESLLETGLSELGVQFGERVYGEEIRLAAAVDDVLRGVSVADYISRKEALKSGEERLLHEALSIGVLSKNQWHVYRNTVPFFKRAGVVVPYAVSYHTITLDEQGEYEKIADDLISKISLEVVEIEAVDGVPVANLILGKNVAVSHFPLEDEEYILKCPPGAGERLKHILPLHEKPYDPEKICEAVMSFLRDDLLKC